MADGLSTAGGVMQGIAPALGAIPVVGQIASGVFTVAGGIMQQQAAKKQAEQAARQRLQAGMLKPRDIQSEYYKKLRADQMAAISGLPNLGYARNQIESNMANATRTIQESSASGAQSLAAVSAALGQQNQAQNELTAEDLKYRAALRQQVSNDLGMIGEKKDVQQGITDLKQQDMLKLAAALENASTYNKQGASNQILGALSSTATAIASNNNGGFLGNKNAPQQSIQSAASTPSYLSGTGIGSTSYMPQVNNQYSSMARSPYASSVNSYGFWQ